MTCIVWTLGVTVNGKLFGTPAPPGSHKQQRTYFSNINIVVDRPKRAYIEITPKKVILDGKDRMVLACHSTVTVTSGILTVAIVGKYNVTVSVGENISFIILLHQYKNLAPYQRDHLGFYIGNSKGLSPNCHGLLGKVRDAWDEIIHYIIKNLSQCCVVISNRKYIILKKPASPTLIQTDCLKIHVQ